MPYFPSLLEVGNRDPRETRAQPMAGLDQGSAYVVTRAQIVALSPIHTAIDSPRKVTAISKQFMRMQCQVWSATRSRTYTSVKGVSHALVAKRDAATKQ